MGNTSCAHSMVSYRAIKVVFIDGRIEVYTRPINAAELMLENPRQFICDSVDLKVGRRIPGLAADEELEPRRLYFLLPMNLLYSVLTVNDMVSLSYKASKALKHGGRPRNIGRIFPILGELFLIPPEVKPLSPPQKNLHPKERYLRQRSWRPALDTIAESPCML